MLYTWQTSNSQFNILEITGEYENYIFNRIPCWNTLLKENVMIDNTVFGDYEIEIIENEEHRKTAKIIGYIGSEDNNSVIIPDTVNGYTVSSIGDYAFSGCESLSQVKIPNTIESIGDYAFTDCESLSQIKIPNTIENIGDDVFRGCTGLKKVELEERLTTLGKGMFGNCRSLEEIRIPDSIHTIPRDIFYYCTSLKTVELPDSITKIEDAAFSFCESLNQIKIPNTIERIGGSVFWDCTGLKIVELEEGLTILGDSMFWGCTSLEEIRIPDSIHTIPRDTFYNCTSLKTVELPHSITKIEDYAFSFCESLSQVKIPNTIESIGAYVFWNCTGLKNVELEEGLTTLGYSMFYECSFLEEIRIPGSIHTIPEYAFYDCTSLKTVELPDSVTKIEEQAFSHCESLSQIKIPNTIESIGGSVFWDCTGLKSVELEEGLTILGDGMFGNCRSLEEIRIPGSIHIIPGYAFEGCTSLKTVELSDSITEIEDYAFSGCESLSQIIIPNTIESIGGSVFSGCTGLKSVELAEGLTTLGDSMFWGCTSLEEIYIPDTVTELRDSIVDDCINLEKLIIPDSVTTISEYNFNNVPKLVLYVEGGSYAEQFARENEIPFEYYLRSNVALELRVKNPDGEILKNGYDIYWYEAGNYQFLGTGNRLKNLEEGKKYQFDLILGEDLSYQYQQPRTQILTASAGNTVSEVVLTPYDQITVNGTVKDSDGQKIPSAKIKLKQTYNGMYEKIIEADVNENGGFSVTADKMAGTVVVMAEGYYNSVYSIPDNPEDRNFTVDAVLKKLPVNKINLTLSVKKAGKKGDEEVVTPLTNTNGLSFRLYNETQQKEITDFTVQYPAISLGDDTIEKEDVIRLSVTDEKKQLADSEETVTLDENKCAALDWMFTQNGSVQIGKISGNEENVVFVFDQENRCVENQTTGKSYQSNVLPKGIYTLVLIKKTNLLRSVDTLDKLSEFGLQKEIEFAQLSVTVADGIITEVTSVEVPVLDESKLYYTVGEETNFWANANSAITGQYVTMRAKYEIDPKYASTGENIKIELPDDVTLVERSLTVDGKSGVCTVSGNTVTANVNKRKGTIRFYVLATKPGNKKIHAYLNFKNNEENVTQPIGSVALDVAAVRISVPEKTGFTEVNVTGKTLANSEVTVYDNGIAVGNTISNKNGSWSLEINLVNPKSYSVHRIYAVIRNQEYDIDFQTDASQLIYNKNYIEVSKVTMINTDWLNKEWVTVFDFLHSNGETGSYDYTPSHPCFTFKVEFTGGDADSLKSVYVLTKNSNGDITYVPCSYDIQSRCWIGTHDYLDFSDVPCSVDVRFDSKTLILCEEEETDQETLESIVEIADLSKTVEEDLEKNVDFADETVEDEKVAFSLMCENDEIAFYQLEVIDYSLFDLNAWEQSNCQMYEYEDGTCSYQTSYTEDGTYITLIALPDEEILVRESLTLPDPGTAMMMFASRARKKFYWSDFLKHSYDGITSGLETLSGLEEFFDLYLEYDDIKTKTEILNNDLYTIRKALNGCPCLDNSGYLSELARYQVQVDAFRDTSYALWGGALLVNGLINLSGARVAKFVSGNVFNCSKKLYRYVQKKCGHSGKGRLMKLTQNGLDFVSDETGDMIGGKVKDKIYEVSNFVENVNYVNNYYRDQYRILEETLRNMMDELTERECPCKKNGTCECFKKNNPDPNITDHPVTPKADPSGYVYEAVPSNRIEGVKSEIYYYDYAIDEFGVKEDEKSEIYWDAENYDQINPQYTDIAGTFGWNVPEGQWLVKFSKEGYDDTDSHNDVAVDEEGYLPVPPIQTEVNTAIVSREAPTVSSVNVYQDEIHIDFSQYMQMDTVNMDNIVVRDSGKIIFCKIRPVNAEYDYEGKNQYASSFVLESGTALNGSVTISVKNVKNYNGIVLAAEYNEMYSVQIRPESIELSEVEGIYYLENEEMTIRIFPAEAGANKTLSVTSYSPSIVSVQETTVITDAEGIARVKLNGNLPGQGVISVTADGMKLSAEQMVTVLDVNTPKALERGDYQISLEKDTYVYNKKAQTPKVTIEGLTENTDFTVTYSNNTNAGTATVKVTGIGGYTGTLTKNFTITKAANKISVSNITKNAGTSVQSFAIGAAATGGKLTYKSNNSKITVSTSGKIQVAANYTGKATIQITASDQNYYTATSTITVTVNPIANTITAANFTKTCSTRAQTFSLGVKRKGSGKITYSYSPRTVKISSLGRVTIPAGFVGRALITVRVAANGIYKASSKTVTITVNPGGTALSTLKNSASRTMAVTWKRNTMVTGYEIQYSTNRKFTSGNKLVRLTRNSIISKKLTKLTKGKTYYVRIRTYKTVSGKKYYSGWSAVKRVKITR